METVHVTLLIVFQGFIAVDARESSTIVSISSEILDPKKIVNESNISALRYGFHKTQECQSFERSFLCIRKCLDLDYDVAVADKNCFCTCYIKKDKEKYKSNNPSNYTRWRLGAPTTRIPPWAVEQTPVNSVDDDNGVNNIVQLGNNSEIETGDKNITDPPIDIGEIADNATTPIDANNATIAENMNTDDIITTPLDENTSPTEENLTTTPEA